MTETSSLQPEKHRSRVIPFRGAHNFRDLGGYPAADGKQVRWGALYRSGHLAKMRRSDQERLLSLGLHTLVDFRSEQEREKNPDRLPDMHSIKLVSLPVLDVLNDAMTEEIYARIDRKDFQGFDPDEKMKEMYRALAVDSVDQYRRFVSSVLEAGGRPVLWHCTAGKDRAGFAAAILLRLLGVDDDVVMDDYMLSARYADPNRNLIFLLRLTRGKEIAQIVASMLRVEREWLQTAFNSIDQQWGSFESYTEKALGLSQGDIDRLLGTLLEDGKTPM
jgi:protein-tyrosine phosphatase